MFGFLKRRKELQATTEAAAVKSAQAEIERLTRRLAKDGDLNDRDSETLASAAALVGISLEAVADAAKDLASYPDAKSLAAKREQAEASVERAERAIDDHARNMETELDALVNRQKTAQVELHRKLSAAQFEADRCGAAFVEQRKIERARWALLGLEDPSVAEELATKKQARQAHLIHADAGLKYRAHPERKIVALELLMLGKQKFDSTLDYVPFGGQTQQELQELLNIAKTIKPGLTKYLWQQHGMSLGVALDLLTLGRGNLLIEINDAADAIEQGRLSDLVLIPYVGTPPALVSEWESRLETARAEAKRLHKTAAVASNLSP